MSEMDCMLCKAVLSIVSTGFVSAVIIRLASWYKYVQLFV
jgi:hypothetical protein